MIRKSFSGYYYWRTRKAIRKVRAGHTLHAQQGGGGDLSGKEGSSLPVVQELETWELIEKCWEKLPPLQHQVFGLRYIQEMSLKEIAALLGRRINAVGQCIHRLSRNMRECLDRMAA